MIMSDISELVPEADTTQVDDTAQYISNYLNKEAPRVKATKFKWRSNLTADAKPDAPL